MATYAENLIIHRDRIAEELAEGPLQPNYSIEGQAVDWMTYRKHLIEELERLTSLITEAEGPADEHTTIVPSGSDRP